MKKNAAPHQADGQNNVLKNRNFMIFLAGQGISNFGDRLSEAALAVLLVKLVGEQGLYKFQTIPWLITLLSGLPLLIGAVVERKPSRKVMIRTNWGLFAITLLFLLSSNLYWFIALQIARQFLDNAFGAAYGRYFPGLVPPQQLSRAQGLQSIVGRFSTIGGQLAGVAGALALGYNVLWLDAITFLLAIAAFRMIPFEVQGEKAEGDEAEIKGQEDEESYLKKAGEAFKTRMKQIGNDVGAGLRFALKNRTFVSIILVYAAAHLCWGAGSIAMYKLVISWGGELGDIGKYQAVQTVAELVAGFFIFSGRITERALPFSLMLLSLSFIGAGAASYLPVSSQLKTFLGGRLFKGTEGIGSNFVGNLSEVRLIQISPKHMLARLRGFIGLSTLLFNLIGKTAALQMLQNSYGAYDVYISVGCVSLVLLVVAVALDRKGKSSQSQAVEEVIYPAKAA
ncbi:MFS transporter [Roseivirga sp. BDSF3-8]|uniref:MFS transporter n=1 Tax=Roseivirga sp. BDSF3-8 TaxID=3241598 RepID=UPI00353271DA